MGVVVAACSFALLLAVFASTVHALPGPLSMDRADDASITLAQAPAHPPAAFGPRAEPAQSPAAPPSAFGSKPGSALPVSGGVSSPGWVARAQIWVLETQQQLHRDLAKAVRELRADPFYAGATLILLSFVYGVLHAVGPGHGKAIISSYIVANRQTVRRGIAISFASAIVQGFSAVALVLVLGVLLNMAGLRMQSAVAQMETISFALVAVVGAWLFFGQVRRVMRKVDIARWLPTVRREKPLVSLSAAAVTQPAMAHSHAHYHHHRGHRGHDGDGHHHHAGHHHHHHDHHHHDDCGCGHSHIPSGQALEGDLSWRRTAAIVLAVGIRPCTGAILVLVFALTQGLFWAGVIATFAMAIGTAITVAALTVVAVTARDLTAKAATSGRGIWAEIFYDALALSGTFLILSIGLVLFFGSLGPARPF